MIKTVSGKSGFTLVELIVITAIIGVLAMMCIPAYAQYLSKTYNASAVSDIKNMKTGMETFYSENNSYPTSLTFQ